MVTDKYNGKHYPDGTAYQALKNIDLKKRAKNRSTARKQQASGKEFEEQLERINHYYAQQGIALISKIPTATKAIPQGNGVKWVPSEKTGCDYIGVYRGKAVAFEAKQSSVATRWDLYSRGSGNSVKKTVADHQQRYLLKHKSVGGLAYVIIKIKPTQAIYKIDIEDYVRMEKEALQDGRKSIPLGYFEQYKVVTHERVPDYLRGD